MKFSLALLLPAAITASAQFIQMRAPACASNGNNCQRGVGGTAGVKPPQSSRLADCSSLNTVTVIPATYTTTTTTTILVPSPSPDSGDANVVPRAAVVTAVTVQPTSVPAYATYCSSAAAYYSACSCAGATPATTTAPTPTSVVTSTVTETCSLQFKVKRGIQMIGDAINYRRM